MGEVSTEKMKAHFPKRLIAFALFGLAIFAIATPLARAEGITEKQAEAILNELKQIRLLLEKMQKPGVARPVQRPTQPTRVKVSIGDGFTMGWDDAPLTLVEFTDYQCPFCRRFHVTTFEELKKNYIDTGKLRYISRDLPLAFHKDAFKAARAVRCAGEQGQFWEMRRLLFVSSKSLSVDAMLKHAETLRVDMAQFRTCLDSQKYVADVQRDIAEARSVGITGTPTFVLGKSASGKIEGVKIVGAQPYAIFDGRIRALLSDNEK